MVTGKRSAFIIIASFVIICIFTGCRGSKLSESEAKKAILKSDPFEWLSDYDWYKIKLIIHSPEDEIISFRHGKALYENAPLPKEFLKIIISCFYILLKFNILQEG